MSNTHPIGNPDPGVRPCQSPDRDPPTGGGATRFSDQLLPDDDAGTRRFAALLDRLTPAGLADVELAVILVEKASRLGLFDDPRFKKKLAFFRRKIAGKTGYEHGRYWKDRMLNYLFHRVRATWTAE